MTKAKKSIRLSEDMDERLTAYADRQDLAWSVVLRMALRAGMKTLEDNER
jgi:predicted DNA-binding protein